MYITYDYSTEYRDDLQHWSEQEHQVYDFLKYKKNLYKFQWCLKILKTNIRLPV